VRLSVHRDGERVAQAEVFSVRELEMLARIGDQHPCQLPEIHALPPWRECSKPHERLRFVAGRLGRGKMAELCRELDISRKSGYEIVKDSRLTLGHNRPRRLVDSFRWLHWPQLRL